MSKATRMKTHTATLILAAFLIPAALTGCQTASSVPGGAKETREGRIDAVLEKAARESASRGGTENLQLLEKIYKRNSDDPVAAYKYARALREAEYLNRAAMVLAPFAGDESGPAAVKTEYAAILLAMGNYKQAELTAQKAVLQAPEDYQAYHYLGIALDAQGMHTEAERAFRKGLDYWEGDPAPIMNNLALNLTSQGYLDEALEILEKAKTISPNRVEIERNLRIVRALQDSGRVVPPKPHKKPGDA